MAQILRSAIAVPFQFVTLGPGTPDLRITFPTGTSPVDVNLASGTYYILLGAAPQDILQVLETAINSAVSIAGRSEIFTLGMTANGYVQISASGTFGTTGSTALWNFLGFGSLPSSASNVAVYQPEYFATFVSRDSNGWVPRTAAAGAETLGGIGYGVNSGIYFEEDEIAFSFIPPDPATRSALGVHQTPWLPEESDYSSFGGHTGVWSLRDVLAVAQAKTLHVALGNFQTLLSSTTAYYHKCTLPTAEIVAPRKERLREGWDAYFRWTVRLLRQGGTPTGTRGL